MAWPSGDAGTAPSPSPPPGPSAPPPPYQPYQPWQSPSAPSASSPGLLFPQPQYAWHTGDPRSSSTQSLAPSLHEGDGRRILLVVYIHGFMGDNTSFRSFPSHVHNYLHEALAESHAIHSKIYPRYKTYKAITVARNNFSEWLQPHESEITDVVLVGHSMGGLLAADVALMVGNYASYTVMMELLTFFSSPRHPLYTDNTPSTEYSEQSPWTLPCLVCTPESSSPALQVSSARHPIHQHRTRNLPKVWPRKMIQAT